MAETRELLDEIKKLNFYMGNFAQIGGITRILDVPYTVDTGGAYADGDVIDSPKSITDSVRKSGGSGIIQSIYAVDGDDQSLPIEFHFFSESITVAADNAAWAPTLAQLEKRIPGDAAIGTWKSVNSIAFGSIKDLSIPYSIADTESELHMLCIAKDALTFTDADNFHVRVGLLLD